VTPAIFFANQVIEDFISDGVIIMLSDVYLLLSNATIKNIMDHKKRAPHFAL